MNTGRLHWWPAYVGVGSNLESPLDQVKRAIAELAEVPETRLVRVSSLYRSAPMGPADQPHFINAVSAMLTRLDAYKLLNQLHKIEEAHGRVRRCEKWGPRTLDLDLLIFGKQIIDADDLKVPHPGIAQRNFVLLPLQELAPHLHVPGLASVQKLTAAMVAQGANTLDIEKITSSNP